MRLTAALLAATALLAAAPALAQQARPLTAAEAMKVLSGKRMSFDCIDGSTGQAHYAANGTATAVWRRPGSQDARIQDEQDTGRVRSAGNLVCIRWTKLNDGREGCFQMSVRGGSIYRLATTDGRLWCDLRPR
jgi:hypothetical protein